MSTQNLCPPFHLQFVFLLCNANASPWTLINFVLPRQNSSDVHNINAMRSDAPSTQWMFEVLRQKWASVCVGVCVIRIEDNTFRTRDHSPHAQLYEQTHRNDQKHGLDAVASYAISMQQNFHLYESDYEICVHTATLCSCAPYLQQYFHYYSSETHFASRRIANAAFPQVFAMTQCFWHNKVQTRKQIHDAALLFPIIHLWLVEAV